MAWVKVLSSVSRNRKFIDAGPAASWLWLCGLVYCQEGLTDGFIPFQALDYLGVKGAQKLKCRLVAARLWDEVEGGWQIHDYLVHNKPAAEVKVLQGERRKNAAEGGRASGFARRKEDREAPVEATQRSNLLPTTKQVASAPIEAPVEPRSETATATATEPAPKPVSAPRAHTGAGAMVGTLPRDHLRHAWCGTFRKCVPDFLHGEFVRALGGDSSVADASCKAFYERTITAIPDEQPIGDEATKFWRTRFAAAFPAPAPEAARRAPAWVQKARAHR